jgi:cell shape-determining protein MreD
MKTDDKLSGNYNSPDNDGKTGRLDTDQLIGLFRKFEKKQAATRRLVIGVNTVLFILYTAVAASQTGATATGYRLCGLGFVLGAAYLFFRYRPLPASAYTLPIMDYLRKAEKQLRYFTAADYLIILPLLIIIGIGGGLIFTGRLSNYTDRIDLLTGIWAVFFTGLCLFGFFAGRKKWLKENSDVHMAVKETLSCLDGENS